MDGAGKNMSHTEPQREEVRQVDLDAVFVSSDEAILLIIYHLSLAARLFDGIAPERLRPAVEQIVFQVPMHGTTEGLRHFVEDLCVEQEAFNADR